MGNTASRDREGRTITPSSYTSPSSNMPTDASSTVCPVDHKAREAWLNEARKAGKQIPHHPIPPPSKASPILADESCDSSQINQQLATPKAKAPSALQIILNKQSPAPLAIDREISTIPRALPPETASAKAARPANNEVESGADKSGKWIYPSEQMFFEAMRRKNHDPKVEDMRTIVPIHNAVNERAWGEILTWERGKGGDSCGGPKLLSFSGLSKDLTPKARLNTLLGYHAPFDRHDWVVDRCGTRVEYVIDFYSGRDEGKPGKSLNFYLDVRPKLNTLEGWKMRAAKLVGL